MIPLEIITAIHATLAGLLAALDKDFVNGSFELLAGFFVLNHCRVLRLHKQARGVSLASVCFFTLWGLWNLYYYPALNQPLSFYGGLFVVAANALYVGMMISYRRAAVIDEHAIYLGAESAGYNNPKTGRPDIKGTKVHSDVLEVSDDTLFPLQGALGYEVTQSMFIGANTLLVEGPSDILYLQVLSQALRKRGREGIDQRWTLCPSGGIDKIAPFVRLFGGNNINVAVLSDAANSDRKKIDAVKKEQILKAGHFFTAADFVGKQEADVEDILSPELYAEILNGTYPVFVLSFCVFRKDDYAERVTPAVRKHKFDVFGHDMVVLHEQDIRKKTGAFSRLGKEAREQFMESLTNIIASADFTLIAVVIDKRRLASKYVNPAHPYHLAMEFGLERLCRLLRSFGQDDRTTHIVCEARGSKEDAELELEFRRIRDGANYFNKRLPFELVIADKKTNSEGMQLADLTARPIGLSVLRPEQPNRAMVILESKFYLDGAGNKNGFGLKVFP